VQCSTFQDFFIRQLQQVTYDPTDDKINKKSPRNAVKLMAITLSIFVTGVAATYFLEARIHLVDRLLVPPVNNIEFNPADGL
jgi:hypothetical protein